VFDPRAGTFTGSFTMTAACPSWLLRNPSVERPQHEGVARPHEGEMRESRDAFSRSLTHFHAFSRSLFLTNDRETIEITRSHSHLAKVDVAGSSPVHPALELIQLLTDSGNPHRRFSQSAVSVP
jgi:hypothetical protein